MELGPFPYLYAARKCQWSYTLTDAEIKQLAKTMTRQQARDAVIRVGTVGDLRKLLLVMIEKQAWPVEVEKL